MPWFRRKRDEPIADDTWTGVRREYDQPLSWIDEPEPAASVDRPSARAAEPSGPVNVLPNGDIEVTASNVADAKLAIKQLRLLKKELSLEKRQINAATTEIRAERRLKTANRGSLPRGGGQFMQAVRMVDRMGRDSRRAKYANALAPLEDEKARLDRKTYQIDSLIAQLESYILQQSST